MKLFSELIRYIDLYSIHLPREMEITSIQYDSRKCIPGSLFIALRGTQTDGHYFIDNALENGAIALILEEYMQYMWDKYDVTFIHVENSRLALATLAHQWFDYPTNELNVFGVTGTNGKTTTTFLLKSIFQSLEEKTGIIGTTGIFSGENFIPATHTTPESLELAEIFYNMKNDGVKNVAMEVSSHSLHQHRVHNIHFDSALFTNLTHEHLDYHKTMDEYAAAKKMLFDMLPEDGIALVFNNSEYSHYMLSTCPAKTKFLIGRTEKADIKIVNEQIGFDGSEFKLEFNDSTGIVLPGKLTFNIKLPGRFNIDNAALAAALPIIKGYSPEQVAEALSKASGAPGRMQRVSLKNGAAAFVDYSHTPDALEKALLACKDILNTTASNGKLICVFGCGGDRDKTKRPLMGKISSELADFSVITSDNPRTEDPEAIIDEIFTGIDKANLTKCERIGDRRQAIKFAVEKSREGDIILIAGKGHEDYQIIGKEKIHFSDVEELEKFA